MQLRDIMTRQVQLARLDMSLQEAAQIMRDHDIGALPVEDGGRIVGVITDRDITVRATAEGHGPLDWMVRDVMTQQVEYAFEEDDIETAARIMGERQIRRLPVLDHDKRLVGIVAQADLARTDHDPMTGDTVEKISRH